MRTTLNLDDILLQDAANMTGIREKTKLIHMGLRSLIRMAAQERLAKLHGKIKNARVPNRRKTA